MQFKVSYGKSTWAYAFLDSNDAGFDELDDDDDRAIALASYIVRECLEDADGASFSMDDVLVECVYGERTNGDSVDVPLPDGHGTFAVLVEQCETLVKLHDLVERVYDVDNLMAVIEHEGWECFDFGGRDWADRIHIIVDKGDYEQFAKEEMDICDDSIPDHLEGFFDYQSYGKYLATCSDYTEQVFNGQSYMMHDHI